MDYVVISQTMRVNVVSSHLADDANAIGHSTVVATFGSGPDAVQIAKVEPDVLALPRWLPAGAVHQSANPKGAPK